MKYCVYISLIIIGLIVTISPLMSLAYAIKVDIILNTMTCVLAIMLACYGIITIAAGFYLLLEHAERQSLKTIETI